MILLSAFTKPIAAQLIDGESPFILAGVSTRVNKQVNLNLYGAYNPSDNIKAVALLPFIQLGKHITASPGYMYVWSPPVNGKMVIEHHLLPALTYHTNLGSRWILEDRNMWWQRIRGNGLDDLSFYRNRLRFVFHTQLNQKLFRVFAGDEAFYSIDLGRWSRNRLGFGSSYAVFKWLTAEAVYTWQTDHVLPNRNVYFFTFTVPLEKYGVFTKSKP